MYDGEEGKLYDWNQSLPAWLEEHLLPALMGTYRPVVVIGEEWHTSWSIVRLSRRAEAKGWGGHVRFFWNANNTFGFERVPWRELNETATITTVSRFMKQNMWRVGVDPHVIPNGIAAQWLKPCDRKSVNALKRLTAGRLLLAKVARWDPDKRWLMALDAIGDLKVRGLHPERKGGSQWMRFQIGSHIYLMTREELENKMAVLLGGRASEHMVFGHLSTGAADDLAKVTDIARSMVMRYGMEEKLGHVAYEAERPAFLGIPDGVARARDFSEDTAREIDSAVRKLIASAFDKATGILKQRRELLNRGAQFLLQKETLNEDDLKTLREPQPVMAREPAQSEPSATGATTGMSI